jgi:hypothetical protein
VTRARWGNAPRGRGRRLAPARGGFALPAALAAVVLAAGLAALAHQSALRHLREADATAQAARDAAARTTLRTRLAGVLSREPLGILARGAYPLGGPDTVLLSTEIRWPWYRVAAVAVGREVVAEVAAALPADLPWCASVVIAGELVGDEDAVTPEAASGCSPVLRTSAADLDRFDSVVVARSVGIGTNPSLVLAGADTSARVWRATARIEVAPGTSVSGLLVAPVVRLGAGATARGGVLARDSLIIVAGARIVGDVYAATAALVSRAGLRLTGSRGRLYPP